MEHLILITGVAGFIGSKIASRFISEGFSVVGVDDLSTGLLGNVPAQVEFIRGDLSCDETVELIPAGCSVVLHLAGNSSGEMSFDNPVSDLEKNTMSTLNLIKYGIRNRVERIVYASSMSVYGAVEDTPVKEGHFCNPLSCYGVSKYTSEGYLRVFQNQVPFVAMRMFNVYGPGQDMINLRQGMVSIYLSQALASGKIQVRGSLDRFRDFIFIDDVVEAWFRAATYPSAIGKTLNIATGVKTAVESLLDKVCDAVPGTEYYVSDSTPGDQAGIYADLGALKACLGMNSFVPLDIGLKRFVEWASAQQTR